jgi:hypothetical protein
VLDEAAPALDHRVDTGTRPPPERSLGLGRAVAVAPPEGGHDPAPLGPPAGEQPHDDVGDRLRRDAGGVGPEVGAQGAGDVGHPHELAGGEEAVVRGRR